MAWIAALQPKTDPKGEQLAILAPTFSGSLPSIAQVLSERKTIQQLDLGQARNGQRLAIYSGSVSSNQAAHVFQDTFDSQVVFHSFVQNDDEILKRFCTFIKHEQPGFDASRVAIISEDETAYGGSGLSDPKNANKTKTIRPALVLTMH